MPRRTLAGYAITGMAVLGCAVAVALGADPVESAIGSGLITAGVMKLVCGSAKETESQLRAYLRWKKAGDISPGVYGKFRNSCLRQYLSRLFESTPAPGLSPLGWLKISSSLSVVSAPGVIVAGLIILFYPLLEIPQQQFPVLGFQFRLNVWAVAFGAHFLSVFITLGWFSVTQTMERRVQLWARWYREDLITKNQWETLGGKEQEFVAHTSNGEIRDTIEIPFENTTPGKSLAQINGAKSLRFDRALDADEEETEVTGDLEVRRVKDSPNGEAEVSLLQSSQKKRQTVTRIPAQVFQKIEARQEKLVWRWEGAKIDILELD